MKAAAAPAAKKEKAKEKTKINTSVNFDIDILSWIDKNRGRVNRSIFINDLLRELHDKTAAAKKEA